MPHPTSDFATHAEEKSRRPSGNSRRFQLCPLGGYAAGRCVEPSQRPPSILQLIAALAILTALTVGLGGCASIPKIPIKGITVSGKRGEDGKEISVGIQFSPADGKTVKPLSENRTDAAAKLAPLFHEGRVTLREDFGPVLAEEPSPILPALYFLDAENGRESVIEPLEFAPASAPAEPIEI